MHPTVLSGQVLVQMPALSLQHHQPEEDIREAEEVELVAEAVLGERLDLARVAVLRALVGVMQELGMGRCMRLRSRRPRIPLEW